MGTMGIQIPNIYTTMGIQKIKHLLNNGGKNNLCGEVIQTTYEQTICEIGIEGNLFKKSYNHWESIMTKTWLTHTWKFCDDNNITIKPNIDTTQTKAKNDAMIMDILNTNGYTKHQLKEINCCRLHQRVATLTDILDLDGKYTRKGVTEPRTNDQHNKNGLYKNSLPKQIGQNGEHVSTIYIHGIDETQIKK